MDKRAKPEAEADAGELRRRAEERLRQRPAAAPGGEADAQRLIHELQVHQVELELQNAELLAAREEIEAGLARYTELYDFAPVGYFTLSRDGTILQLNLAGARLLGAERAKLENRRFGQFVADDARAAFNRGLAEAFASPGKLAWEVRLARAADPPQFVRIEAIARESGRDCLAAVTDVTYRRLFERALREHQEALERAAELGRRLIDVQESERRRLAEALHDRMSANLAAIGLDLETIAKGMLPEEAAEIRARMADIRALLQETSAGIREICFDLRPASLDYWGLIRAVEGYAEQLTKRTGLAVRVEARGFESRLSADQEVLVFRIIQEALTNCARHSGASAVEVVFAAHAAGLRITIADDGVGFVPPGATGHGTAPGLGLLTMRERAEYAGGRLRIESRPGHGTRVVLEI